MENREPRKRLTELPSVLKDTKEDLDETPKVREEFASLSGMIGFGGRGGYEIIIIITMLDSRIQIPKDSQEYRSTAQ